MASRLIKGMRKNPGAASSSRSNINSLLHRTILPERWIACDGPEMAQVEAEIVRCRWTSLTTRPDMGVEELVQEFYCNLKEALTESTVQGVRIEISHRKINRLLCVRSIRKNGVLKDDFMRLMDGSIEVDGEDVIRVVGMPGVAWRREARSLRLQRGQLNALARFWLVYISHNILPGLNVKWVIKERTLMIYALMTERSIDLGTHIQAQLEKPIPQGSTASLYFLCLITKLCAEHGIGPEADSTLISPGPELNSTTMSQLRRNTGETGGHGRALGAVAPGAAAGPYELTQADRDYNFFVLADRQRYRERLEDDRWHAIRNSLDIRVQHISNPFPELR